MNQHLNPSTNKHLNKEKLCFKCNNLKNNKEEINIFKVRERHYGSIFHGDCFEVQLCDKCKALIDEDWFNNEPIRQHQGVSVYHEENKLYKFLNSFVIENKEYVFNCDNDLMPKMDRNDWILMNK